MQAENILFLVDFIDGDNRFRVRLKDIRVTPVCTVLAQFAAVIIIPKAVLTNSDFLADEIAVIVIFVLSMVSDGNNTGNRDFGFCITVINHIPLLRNSRQFFIVSAVESILFTHAVRNKIGYISDYLNSILRMTVFNAAGFEPVCNRIGLSAL